MDIRIFSRANLLTYLLQHDIEEPFLILSIVTPLDRKPFFKNPHAIIVTEFFYDEENVMGMSEEHAKHFADAVKYNKDKVEHIFVHCDAGISRSAGVAAATMKYLNGDDWPIWNSYMYSPNTRCYRLMMNEYFGAFDADEAYDKYVKNMEIYKEKLKYDFE